MDKLFVGWLYCRIRLLVLHLLLLFQDKVSKALKNKWRICATLFLTDIRTFSSLISFISFQNVRTVSNVILFWIHGFIFRCSWDDVWNPWICWNLILCPKDIFHRQNRLNKDYCNNLFTLNPITSFL